MAAQIKKGNLKNSLISRKPGWLIIVCLTTLIAGLVVISLTLSGCSGTRKVELGVNNHDTITSSDPCEGEDLGGGASSRWWYHGYQLNVEVGYSYEFTLNTIDGVTMGIWSEDKGGWIVQANYTRTTSTATYRFERGGTQKLWVEAAEVPAEYSWYVTR